MCQGNYDLDSDDDCVIDIPFNGDLMISQQHNLQEEDEGLFGIPFNEDWQNWRQHRGFLLTGFRSGDLVMEDGNQLAGLNPKAVAEIMEKKDLKRLQELGGAEKVASILGSDVGVGKVAEGQQSANLDTTITVYEIHHFIPQSLPKNGQNLTLLSSCVHSCIWDVSSFFGVRKMEKRLNERNRVKVEVVRSGKSQIIRLCDIVEGDIVRLSEGNLIPADGLLVSGNRMVVDGALHKEISCNGNPFLYYGSKVVEGHGRMLVTSVGTNMELSKLMSSVTNYQDNELLFKDRLKKPSPYADIDDQNKEALLEDRIGKPLGWLGNFALLMPIFCVVVKFILFFFWKNNKSNVVQTLKGAIGVEWAIKLLKQILDKGGKMNLLATIISTLVFGLQHGVKIVISICLNYWNVIRGSSEVTPQNLSAPGTMGIVTVICIDASGGLLYEKMDVSRFWMWQEAIDDQSHYEVSPAVLEALSSGVGASALVPEIHSIPTDDVLISWAELEWGMNIEFLKQRLTILKYGKLSSTKEGRGVVLRKNGSDENIMHLHWNGDAKTILDMCSHYYKCRGEIHGIKDQKSEIEKVIKEMQDDGLQPIAFAYKQTDVEQLEEDGLILLALVGVKYQFQEEMKSVVKTFQSAGIRIILVSENELSTSRAMACELGIFTPGSINGILEGQEFRELTYDARKEKIEQVTLMGRRDAPVLKEADIGITVGTWSTEMTNEISDIVLASDKSWSSLIPVLEYGRHDYHKIATMQGTKEQSTWQEKCINYNQGDVDQHITTSILSGHSFAGVSVQGNSYPWHKSHGPKSHGFQWFYPMPGLQLCPSLVQGRMQWAFCFLIAALAWGADTSCPKPGTLIFHTFSSTSHCPAFFLKFQCC
ncbi:putative calcium-transporting ATPase 13, plasma membrane-type [Vitis vinifera]|uniref:Putative calcium-transporting ATPase 13, plasma membrane-type n=1 Tax=Vitis vinifera TaxID=29760 RepID=A0A438IEQ2_VITVI|nr:putative calcium-transporting ATPase 13, plasma membrane-type [Vitis vinifera]